MNSKKRIVIILAILGVTCIAYDNYYTSRMIAGTYQYTFPNALVEGPKSGDNLILNEDGTFQSDFWGDGVYKIDGSTLELNYTSELGRGGFQLGIYRPFFLGKPRLSVVRDLEYYFKKKD